MWHLQYENRTALARTRVRIEYEGEGPFVNCEYGFVLGHILPYVVGHVFGRERWFFKTFSAGWVPPDAPGDAKVRLGGASGGHVCFFIDF